MRERPEETWRSSPRPAGTLAHSAGKHRMSAASRDQLWLVSVGARSTAAHRRRAPHSLRSAPLAPLGNRCFAHRRRMRRSASRPAWLARGRSRPARVGGASRGPRVRRRSGRSRRTATRRSGCRASSTIPAARRPQPLRASITRPATFPVTAPAACDARPIVLSSARSAQANSVARIARPTMITTTPGPGSASIATPAPSTMNPSAATSIRFALRPTHARTMTGPRRPNRFQNGGGATAASSSSLTSGAAFSLSERPWRPRVARGRHRS